MAPAFGIKGLQVRISNHFEEKGFTGAQIAKAIFVHEVLGICLLGKLLIRLNKVDLMELSTSNLISTTYLATALTWGGCYYYPPSQHPLLKQPIAKMLSAIPSGIGNRFQQNGFLNSKFGSAYIESSCCRKIIRPFTLPGKLFVTFKAVEAWSDRTGSNLKKSGLESSNLQPKMSCLFLPLILGLSDIDDIIF